jgi:hypothetical protein
MTEGKNSKINSILFARPLFKFIMLLVLQLLTFIFINFFPEDFPIRIFISVLNVLIAFYFIFLVIHVSKKSFSYLMNPTHIGALIGSYIILIVMILLVFSTIYNVVDLTGLGYIKYGSCSDNFNSSMIASDATISRDFFYFSAMTFFGVGYGDICPMGLAKIISIIAALIGHVVSVILVALILNNYINMKPKREDK